MNSWLNWQAEKIVNPNWLHTLEQDGDAQPTGQPKVRPATGAEIRTEQEKAKIRRAKKTADCERGANADIVPAAVIVTPTAVVPPMFLMRCSLPRSA